MCSARQQFKCGHAGSRPGGASAKRMIPRILHGFAHFTHISTLILYLQRCCDPSFVARMMMRALTIAAAAAAAAAQYPGETLIFSDDFKTFNMSLWKHEIT